MRCILKSEQSTTKYQLNEQQFLGDQIKTKFSKQVIDKQSQMNIFTNCIY